MKRRIAIVGTAAILIGCSSASLADYQNNKQIIKYQVLSTPLSENPMSSVLGSVEHLTMLEQKAKAAKEAKIAEIKRQTALYANKRAISQSIDKLYKYVNKTRYVFSGSTPRGWDCSGLVRWFYGEVGIEVPHSASKQGLLKPKVKNPLPGDIVVFKYNNAKNFIHSGIYIGNNKMIHAGFKKGNITEVISLNDPSFDGQKHYFVRVLEMPNE